MSARAVKIIHSLSDFVGLVEQMRIFEKSDLFSDPHLFFRGQSNVDYKIQPSIGRYINNGVFEPLQFTFFEQSLIQRAKSEYPQQFGDDLLPFALLAKLQHYGIPTRLLDITLNAIVALFFACISSENDGEVIVFQTENLELGFEPEINALADTCEIHAGENDMSYTRFWEIAKRQKYYKFPSSYLDRNLDDETLRESPEEKYAKTKFYPRFVLPQQLTQRQKNQGSLFILFPNAPMDWGDAPGIGDKIEPIVKDSSIVKDRILIPQNIKSQLIADLTLFGIGESLLFPEDIDRGCNQIVREYRDRLMRSTIGCHNTVG